MALHPCRDERSSATRAKQPQDELVQVRDQQNRLLNLRMLEEIDADTFASTSRDLRDREAELNSKSTLLTVAGTKSSTLR
ncbi:MAG: hypothetical protein L0Y71_01390 [Gemmataceae bacterium]|nr:hypothetical protein [Gemmataceae bacterium]